MMHKIIKIDGTDTTIELTLSDGSKSTQTISHLPVNDLQAFGEAVEAYIKAYEAGLEATKVVVDPALGVAENKITNAKTDSLKDAPVIEEVVEEVIS